MTSSESLNVIALISGGKDSFYSVLHCLHHGHRVVALANLYPPPPVPAKPMLDRSIARFSGGQVSQNRLGGDLRLGPSRPEPSLADSPAHGSYDAHGTEDLNSFMYQTAGHQLVPLYAAVTGIPLYRGIIAGKAVQSGLTYTAPQESPHPASRASSRLPPEAQGAPKVMVCATSALSQSQHAESTDVAAGTPAAFSSGPGNPGEEFSSVPHRQSQQSDLGNASSDEITYPQLPSLGTGPRPAAESSLSDAGATNSARHRPAACSCTNHPGIVSPMEHDPTSGAQSAGSKAGPATTVPERCRQPREGSQMRLQGTNCAIGYSCAESRLEMVQGGQQLCGSTAPSPPPRNTVHDPALGTPESLHISSTKGCTSNASNNGNTGRLPEVTSVETQNDTTQDSIEDETESMTNLIRIILAAHPEANALCAGAILSTYQRVRVESVATRLGLTPIAFLWKFPILPPPAGQLHPDPAQLLMDMSAASLSARIVKVASGGLDDGFLWEEVTSPRGISKLKRALARFGGGDDGAVIGEGGEFETLAIDGPPQLFKGRIEVEDQHKVIIREGADCSWLGFEKGVVRMKADSELQSEKLCVREPPVLDPLFRHVQHNLLKAGAHDDLLDSPPPFSDESDHTLSAGTNFTPVRAVEHWVGMSTDHVKTVQESTRHIMNRFRDRLSAAALPPAAVISSLVVLRQMSDFAAFNSVYGSSFSDPLPPARVCIACGDVLPRAANVLVYLTVLAGATGRHVLSTGNRRGLHVQSRSYWAPANIGPYSQAIEVPLVPAPSHSPADSSSANTEPMAIAIAGQIPLLPATMDFPRSTGGGVSNTVSSLILSLQHLWRIAVDVRAQWFACAVVYVPRIRVGEQRTDVRQSATLVGKVWRDAHLSGVSNKEGDNETGNEELGGPDLWDRKFNPAFRMFAAELEGERDDIIPAWSIFDSQEGRGEAGTGIVARCQALLPSVFVAEVDTLPRSAPVEWHIPLSLRALEHKSAHMLPCRTGRTRGGWTWTAEHLVLDSGMENRFVHSTIWVTRDMEVDVSISALLKELKTCWKESLSFNGDDGLCKSDARDDVAPYLVYFDETSLRSMESLGKDEELESPVVPCKSLYTGKGEKVAAVAYVKSLSLK